MSDRRRLPSSSLTPGDLSGMKILVVDDHSNTVRLIGDVLRAAGVGEVYTASDGLKAREVLYHRQPDMIFTDSRMPFMDGMELTRSIRRAAVIPDTRVPNPEVPIVMVTSERSAGHVHRARLAGVNEFVIKPFTPAALLSRIQLVLTKPRPFIVSEVYVGPCRRRRVELNYSGPMRRGEDPVEVSDSGGRAEARDTIRVELDAMRRMISARGTVDRPTLQMIHRVMQHTVFRARQVRDKAVEWAAVALVEYVDEVGLPELCDIKIIEGHFTTIANLLGSEDLDAMAAA